MKAWITKYALSIGIIEVEGEQVEVIRNFEQINSVFCFKRSPVHRDEYMYGSDWHKTKESAIKKAEEMRIKKLQSLDKQIKKISALKFDDN